MKIKHHSNVQMKHPITNRSLPNELTNEFHSKCSFIFQLDFFAYLLFFLKKQTPFPLYNFNPKEKQYNSFTNWILSPTKSPNSQTPRQNFPRLSYAKRD